MSTWEDKNKVHLKRKALREKIVSHMGGKCAICKYVGFPSTYDLHHYDPRTKGYSISQRVAKFEKLLPELEKCVLLCCRCHREVHEGLHPEYLTFDSTEAFGWEYFDLPNDLSFEEEAEVNEVVNQVAES